MGKNPNKESRKRQDRSKNMSPGDLVSVDQLESSTSGFME
jgi:hypothetical protein